MLRLGDFMIERTLGKGGMGIVFLATEMSLQRQVALKVLPLSMNSDETFCQRFLVEARAAAALDHPNIVRVYAVGRDAETGRIYLSMEYVPGRTLDDWINGEDPLTFADILHVTTSVAAALDVAWERNIVHRDIKPKNIMLGARRRVTILDFGLAKVRHSTQGLTMPGMIIGSPEYMSPEQSEGRPIDVRSDLYSLGVVLYEMLGGEKPFSGNTPAGLIHLHAFANPRSICTARRNVPREFEQVICKLLAKDPDDRYPSPAELIADLGLIEDKLIRASRLAEAPSGLTVLPVGFTQPGKIDDQDTLDLGQEASALKQRASGGGLRRLVITGLLLGLVGAGVLAGYQNGWWIPQLVEGRSLLSEVQWSEPLVPWPRKSGHRQGSGSSLWAHVSDTSDVFIGTGQGSLGTSIADGFWRIEGRLLPCDAADFGVFVHVGERVFCGLTVQRWEDLHLVSLDVRVDDSDGISRARALTRQVELPPEGLPFALSVVGNLVAIEVDGKFFAHKTLDAAASRFALSVVATPKQKAAFAGLYLRHGSTRSAP